MTRSSHPLRSLRRAAFAAQALLVAGLPFVRVGGESALRFDVPTLTLHAAGAALQIDELFLVLAVALAGTFAFALATVTLGRAWCGWACPQSVLSELARPFAEALRVPARRGAGAGARPWLRAAGAAVVLAAASAAVAANLLWYFVPPGELAARLLAGALGPALGGTWAVLGLVLFADLAFVRFRFCATVCPYAKLQGAMFDGHTLAIAYDARRDSDCVECKKCLRVCPTGIDIRRGLQVACVACGECVDACGPIMTRLGKRNLIGYAWGEAGRPRKLVRSATVALAALTAASVSLAAAAASSRRDLDLDVAAAPGAAPRRTPDGRAANALDVSLTNRGHGAVEVRLALYAGGEPATLVPAQVTLAPGEHRRVRVLAAVRLPAGAREVDAELSAEAPGSGEPRMTRRLRFVPPDPETSR